MGPNLEQVILGHLEVYYSILNGWAIFQKMICFVTSRMRHVSATPNSQSAPVAVLNTFPVIGLLFPHLNSFDYNLLFFSASMLIDR